MLWSRMRVKFVCMCVCMFIRSLFHEIAMLSSCLIDMEIVNDGDICK